MSTNDIHLISGGFDPIHSGHIDLLAEAGKFHCIVALNSDDWLIRKKGNYFMTWHHRAKILRSMARVSRVIAFDDSDDSACDAIEQLKLQYPDKVINFYNGGDRNGLNILEALRYAGDPMVKLHFGIGGNVKQDASSDMLERWVDLQTQSTPRSWGEYTVLTEYDNAKVKTLRVQPGQSLSVQKHQHRSEHWFVVKGTATASCTTELTTCIGTKTITTPLSKHEIFTIPAGQWHQLSNNTEEELVIVEIQYGERCEESDITRETDK